jgi:hypothetical protein
MADEKTTRGRAQDRDRVAGGEGYEVEYFARKHGITPEQARQLRSSIGILRLEPCPRPATHVARAEARRKAHRNHST